MKKMFFAHLRTGISMSVIILLLAFNSTDSFFERLFFSLKKEVHQTINTVKLAALDEFAPGDVCNNLASNAIGGNVWEDHNADGDRSTETTVYGVAGIQVSLYDAQNQQIATVSTDADGNYLFSNLTESKYRVEFVIPNTIASYTNSTLAGVNSNSTVQFVAPGNCANLGLINPAQYCDEAPFLITPCYISGDPAAGGSSGIGDVLVSYPYAAGATKSDVNPLALNKDIGTTWGIAYERTGQNIYAAAMMKRHAGFGPLGIGGIYKINHTDPKNPVIENWLDLAALGVNVGTNPRNYALPAGSNTSSTDPEGFDAVGKIGLGDLDISEDEKTLYVINLNNNGALVAIDIASKAVTKNVAIPNPGCGAANDVRPWGLSIYKGKIYIGLICSGENGGGGDMQFFVIEYDGANFKTVLNESLNYEKGFIHLNYNKPNAPELCKNWETWTADFNEIHTAGVSAEGPRWCRPQPILSDIEFDLDGSMVLAFMDRTGHQTGYLQATTNANDVTLGNGYVGGDILRAYNNKGVFVLENEGTTLNGGGCGLNNQAGAIGADTILQGPGGGEYYCGEKFIDVHQEISLGGMVLYPSDNHVALNVMDPTDYYTGGTMWLNNSTGQSDRVFELYSSNATITATPNQGTFGKAAGLGDLELSCAPAPIEIGNYVWNDENADGIQNPNEVGIDGVMVELLKNGVIIASTVTQNGGQYYFTADGNPNQNWMNTGDKVLPNMEYCLRINLNEAVLKQSIPTVINSDHSTNGNIRDNDAKEDNGYAKITLTTSNAGAVTHEYDFGFTSNLCLGNYVWMDKNSDGIQDANETGIANIQIELTKNNVVIASTTTDNEGYYLFSIDGAKNQNWTNSGDKVLPNMDYTIRIPLTQSALAKHDLTGANQTTDTNDNDAVLSSNYAVINLTTGNAGSCDLSYDIGFVPKLCVGNKVWLDSNNDGLANNAENGIEGVELILYKVGGDGTKGQGNDTEIARDTTDNNGSYLFGDLDEGIYFIKVNDGIPSNLVSSLGSGVNGLSASAYEPGIASSSDIDNDDNGTQMGTMVMSDTFSLKICTGPTNDGDNDSNTNLSIDFGFIPHLSVGTLIYNDLNNNGLYENGEPTLSGIEVQLYQTGIDGKKSDDDVLISSQTTQSDGQYLFDALKPGDYYVKLNNGIPTSMVSATGEGISDITGTGPTEPAADPDTNTNNNDDNGSQMGNMIMSELFNLELYGEPINDGDNDPNTNLSIDFGLIQLMSLGNFVWYDNNNDGLFTKGESGVEGVETILYQLGADGQKATTDDIEIARDTTDAGGNYLFTKLLPNDYYIKLADGIPLGYGSSTGEGIMEVDGVGPYEMTAPDPDNDINDDDNGEQMNAMIMSDIVTLAFKDEPTNDGDNDNQSNLSVDFGLFQLLRLGNQVWEDYNNDGDMDIDEPGIAGVETILYQVGPDGQKATADDVEIARDTTDAKGYYIFIRLFPGEYYVKLNSGINGYQSSTGEGISQLSGTGTFETAPDPDNDVDNEDNGTQMGTMVMSDLIMLEFMGEPTFEDNFVNSNFTLDFGLFQPLSLGNLVWLDDNNNGKLDNNEAGLAGIEVILYEVGTDGQKATADDTEVGKTTTNNTGHYSFDGLKPGNYYVKLTNLPTQYTSSNGAGIAQIGGNGPTEPGVATNTDIDSDDNGTQMGNMVMSDVVTLQLYAEPLTDGDNDSKTNMTVDFALLKNSQIKIYNPCTCLDNATSPTSGDGQFEERIVILSTQPNQIWAVMAVEGAYINETFPVTVGAVAQADGTEDGQYRYIFDVRHFDGKGYSIKFSNGNNNLTARNLCHYQYSCHYNIPTGCQDCTPGVPVMDQCEQTFLMGTDGTPRIDSLNCCDDKSTFADDGTIDGLYVDTAARNDIFTICPQNQWQRLQLTFTEFGLDQGDTLYVYDGRTIADSLLGKFSGPGVSATGGWVASTCSPSKNGSSCLTFQLKTDGDNNKGIGWHGKLTCTDRNIQLSPPNIQASKFTCTQTTDNITIKPATVTADCGTVQDTQIVRIYNGSGVLCKDTCLAYNKDFEEVFAAGKYQIEYKLKSDTTKTTRTVFGVQIAPPICNDVVKVPLGSNCAIMLSPDDLLEGECDTIVDTVYYYITIRGKGKNGQQEIIAEGGGKGGNYPMLTKEQFEKYGGQVTAEIKRSYYDSLTLNICNDGVQHLTCSTLVEIEDNSGPWFNEITRDTFKVCAIDLTEAGLGLKKPTAVDNCTEAAVKFSSINVLTDGGICDTTRVEVLWTASDGKGNSTTAKQHIVLVRADKNDLVLPDDRTLSCGFDTDATFKDLTKVGIPSLKVGRIKNGVLVPTDTVALSTEAYVCGYILQQKDINIPADCGKKLFRYFDLLDWCDSDSGPIRIDTQLINLKDTLAPAFTVTEIPFQHLALGHFECTYDLNKLSKPTATDNCSTVSVSIDSVYRIENGQLWEIPPTDYTKLDCDSFRIVWKAEDACHEQLKTAKIRQEVLIEDVTKPSVICADKINVSIGVKEVKMHYSAFDKGSYDACGIKQLEVSRDGETWGEYVYFGCEDVHNEVKVHLRATDKKGNQNTCWASVLVEDKIQPICSDLSDRTGTCDAQHAEVFGLDTDANGNGVMDESEWTSMTDAQVAYYNAHYDNPNCSDNAGKCFDLKIEQQYQLISWPCGILDIKRRFRAIDWNGEGNTSNWEEQHIKISYKANWTLTFPADWTGTCGDAIPTSEVEVINGKCDLLAVEMEEKTFVTNETSCLKIARTFTVINWCNYQAGDPGIVISRQEGIHGTVTQPLMLTAEGFEKVGKIQYTQILKLKDKVAPVVSIQEPDQCINGIDSDAAPYGVEDLTPGTSPYECDEIKTWTATATDCATAEHINWKSHLYEDGILVYEGTSNTITYIVRNKSVYEAEFWAYDGCGNSGGAKTDAKKFWDCKKPTPYCLHGVAVELMPSGMIQIWAKDLDRGSFDNCTPSDKLDIRLYHQSLGARPTSLTAVKALPKQVTFNCGYLGTQTVELYVIDEEDNWDFCVTHVIIQDNMGACNNLEPQAAMARIEGTILDWKGQTIENVMVQTANTSTTTMTEQQTQADGLYTFELPMYADYSVQPIKDEFPLNGVSTFDVVLINKHILGIQPFESSYQFIAADVNQSGTVTAFDMVQVRRLILNLDKQFANNTSWKFVMADYALTTEDLINVDFPTLAFVSNLEQNSVKDFTAIKIGDVNGNAVTNALQATEDRTNRNKFNIEVPDLELVTGQHYVVDFSTNQVANIEGYQFTLDFGQLQFEKLENGQTGVENFGLHLLSKGLLTTSWNNNLSATQQQATTTLFKLHFTATQDGKLSEQLTLAEHPTAIEAYDNTGEVLDVELVFNTKPPSAFQLFQNQPNPFKEQTQIQFYLPEDSYIVLSLRDEMGRLLKTINADKVAGLQTIAINTTELPTGVIYYQLETKFGIATKRMIRVE